MDGYGGDASDAIPRVPRRGPPPVPVPHTLAHQQQLLQAHQPLIPTPPTHGSRPRSWESRAVPNLHAPPHKRSRTGGLGDHHARGRPRRGGGNQNFGSQPHLDFHETQYDPEDMPDPAAAAAACAAAAAAAGMGHHAAPGMNPLVPPGAPARPMLQGGMHGTNGPDISSAQSGPEEDIAGVEQGPMSFKDFLLKQPDEISPADAQRRYSEYVADFMKRQPSQFFEEHKDDEWFRERYHPEAVRERQARIKREVGERAVEYAQIWDRCGSEACVVRLVANSSRSRGGAAAKRKASLADTVVAVKEEGCRMLSSADSDSKPFPKGDTKPVVGERPSSPNAKAEVENFPTEQTEMKCLSGEAKTIVNSEVQRNVHCNSHDVENTVKFDSHGLAIAPITPTTVSKTEDACEVGQSIRDRSADGLDDLQPSEDNGALLNSIGEDTNALPQHPVKGEKCAEEPGKQVVGEPARNSQTPFGEGSCTPESREAFANNQVAASVSALKSEANTRSDSDAQTQSRSATLDAGDAEESQASHPGNELSGTIGGGMNTPKNEKIVIPQQSEKERGPKEAKREDGTRRTREDVLPLQRDVINDTIFLRNIPVRMSRKALEFIMSHGRNGDQDFKLVRFKIGEINPSRGLLRYAWAVYPDEDTAARAMESTYKATVYAKEPYLRGEGFGSGSEARIQDGTSSDSLRKKDAIRQNATRVDGEDERGVYVLDTNLNVHRKRRFSSGRVMPPVAASQVRIEVDAGQAERLMRRFDEMREVDSSLCRLTPEFLSSLPSADLKLDYCICYLREVHYYCYYSGNEYLEDPTSMLPPEVRPTEVPVSLSPSALEAGARWEAKLDDRVASLLARLYDRPRSNAEDGRELQEKRLQEFFDENTKNEGPGRFRCLLPPLKLFKGPEYVHKHIRVKHPETVEEIFRKADLEQYRVNFNKDPAKEELLSIYAQGELGLAPGTDADGGTETNGPQGPNPVEAPMISPGGMNLMAGNYLMGANSMPTNNMGMYHNPGAFMGMGMGMMPSMQMGVMPNMGHMPQMYGTPSMMMMNNPSGFQTGYQPGYGMAPQTYNGHLQEPTPPVKGSDGPPRSSSHGGRRSRGRGRGRSRGGNANHSSQSRLDPRARGSSRGYNDLDAPSSGSQMAYDDV